jgi:farnesyl-diphosphate farnesyltransferase
MEPAAKATLLERWARVLEGREAPGELAAALASVAEESPDALVARNAGRVHGALLALAPGARAILVRHTADSSRGMARWALRGPDIPDEAALDDYMHEVAGRVGWLLTELFAASIPAVAHRREEMMALGREFGLGLQTVNVIRGLRSDWERGWVFIPRSFAPDGTPDVQALLEGPRRDAGAERALLGRVFDKADAHLDAARRYLAGLPARAYRVRLFCLLPYLFAVRTLAVSRAHPDLLREEAKIGRDEVRAIVRWSRLLGWSDAWVTWYGHRLSAPDAR